MCKLKLSVLVGFIACLFVIAGCSDDKSVNSDKPVSSSSEKSTKSEAPPPKAEPRPEPTAFVKSDFDFAIKTTSEQLNNKTNYPFVEDVRFEVNIEQKKITMAAVVANSTSPAQALDFADTMIRQFAIFAPKIPDAPSQSKDYYGGIYDIYTINVGVTSSSNVKNPNKWFLNHYIMPKMHTKQAPKLLK